MTSDQITPMFVGPIRKHGGQHSFTMIQGDTRMELLYANRPQAKSARTDLLQAENAHKVGTPKLLDAIFTGVNPKPKSKSPRRRSRD